MGPDGQAVRRRGGVRSTILLVFAAIIATVVIIVAIGRCSSSPASPFPQGWVVASWSMPKSATPAEMNDGAQALLEEVAHLGDPNARATVEGNIIHVGAPLEYEHVITVIEGRTFTPSVSLRVLLQSVPTANDPHNANLQVGQACVTDYGTGLACSSDRSVIGQFGAEVVDGASIAGADALAPQSTATIDPNAAGGWSVAIQFTAAGAKQIAYVASQAAKGTQWKLVFLATIESTDKFALTPMTTAKGVEVDASGVGHVTGLTQPQALHIAGTLRIARQPVEIRTAMS